MTYGIKRTLYNHKTDVQHSLEVLGGSVQLDINMLLSYYKYILPIKSQVMLKLKKLPC